MSGPTKVAITQLVNGDASLSVIQGRLGACIALTLSVEDAAHLAQTLAMAVAARGRADLLPRSPAGGG